MSLAVHFYANCSKGEAVAALSPLAERSRALGLEVVDGGENADIVIALGGDGTILRAAHAFRGAAVLGFNLGGLGYLASVGRRDFASSLELLAQGRYRIVERTCIGVSKPGGGEVAALNDVVIVREMTGHAAALDLAVDGHEATRYLADGIVIATPTGSTAYSLAAGGPVLTGESAALVVTPVNPHALGTRAIVVPDRVTISVTQRIRSTPAQLGVYADGEVAFRLEPGETATVRRSKSGARFVELDGYDPYHVLASKLGWNDERRTSGENAS